MIKTKAANLLPDPALYFPIVDDRYSTRAGLIRFGKDLGNGLQDTQLFQFDNQFTAYRDNKLKTRQQAINDFVCTDTADTTLLTKAARFMLQQLCLEHNDYFSLQTTAEQNTLDCLLSGEQLLIGNDYQLLQHNEYDYQNLFDALAMQVQEDVCLMQVHDSTTELVAAHLCAANHWSAREKLQLSMPGLHQHVPGFANDNREPDMLLGSILNKATPYTRFAWGLAEHAILNQHPQHVSPVSHSASDKLFMRIERQVIWPIQGTPLILFTIRTYFRDCADLGFSQLSSLINAIQHMDTDTLQYKRLDQKKVLKTLTGLR